jgi:hypothetical protein
LRGNNGNQIHTGIYCRLREAKTQIERESSHSLLLS